MSTYPLTIFHDGNCPVCRLDVANLKARNSDGRLRFVDIAGPAFDPAPYGLSLAEFGAQIRGQCADGRMLTGMDVFRLAYRAAGLGWVVAASDWHLLRGLADRLYRRFARHRHWIGRHFGGALETLAAWQANRRAIRCRNGVCGLKAD